MTGGTIRIAVVFDGWGDDVLEGGDDMWEVEPPPVETLTPTLPLDAPDAEEAPETAPTAATWGECGEGDIAPATNIAGRMGSDWALVVTSPPLPPPPPPTPQLDGPNVADALLLLTPTFRFEPVSSPCCC